MSLKNPFLIRDNVVKDNNIRGVIKSRWVEDSWSQLTERSLNEGSTLGFLGLAVSPKRLIGLAAFIGAALFLLFGMSFYLQLLRGHYYLSRAEANRLRVKAVPAERGIIYDRELKPLVTNVPTFNLELITADLPKNQAQMETVLKKIAEISLVNVEEIKRTLNEFKNYHYRAVTIKDNLDYESAVRLLVKSAELPGLSIEKRTRREYLSGTANILALSHILGYLGKVSKEDLSHSGSNTAKPSSSIYLPTDYIGKTGLEKSYETVLRGKHGKKEIEVDAAGREKGVVAQEAPLSGKSLILSLDLELQQKIEEVLARHLLAASKRRGAAVALNPQNGEIFSMVSLPAYDNNIFSRGLSQEDYNKLIVDENHPLFSRAISGEYPSGSLIKPLLAAAALNEGIITSNTSFESSGGLQVAQWFFPDWKPGGHGLTNVTKALAESVNTFFYIVGGGYKNFVGLGVERILNYYKKFGLTKQLGIDLPNEAAGFLPSPYWKESAKGERWYIGDTYNISIGQGDVLVTPLQAASFTAALANGGALYRPHLVKAVVENDGQVTALTPEILMDQLVPESVLEVVKRGLRSAVTSGSAQRLADLKIAVAGKTGTAQWSKNKSPHAWFSGFAPVNNAQIVLTVLIEEGEEGSRTAVPVADEILEWWANRLTAAK